MRECVYFVSGVPHVVARVCVLNLTCVFASECASVCLCVCASASVCLCVCVCACV